MRVVIILVTVLCVGGVFMGETDVIGHLIDIEREASEILFDAQEKSDATVSTAKSEAEADFKSGYEEIVKECESSYEVSRGKITEEYDDLLKKFEEKIKSAPKDTSGFNSLLDDLLFGK